MKFLLTVLLICIAIATAYAAPQPILSGVWKGATDLVNGLPVAGGLVKKLPVGDVVNTVVA